MKCKHCGQPIEQRHYRWHHIDALIHCTLQMPRPRPRAEPEDE